MVWLVSFRPLIRGFFFYEHQADIMCLAVLVSVPLFGDSFFILFRLFQIKFCVVVRFRPLIRGFFFYAHRLH